MFKERKSHFKLTQKAMLEALEASMQKSPQTPGLGRKAGFTGGKGCSGQSQSWYLEAGT